MNKKNIFSILIAAVAGIALGVGGTLLVTDAINKNAEDEHQMGGVQIANPVAGMSEEEARAIASALGEGKDMGTWQTMSGDEFMEWWRSANNITEGADEQ